MAKFKRLVSIVLMIAMVCTTLLSTGMIVHASMLPLKEVNAYLVLNEKTDDELKSMNLDDVLSMLVDSNGNRITISSDATTVWRYVKSNEDGLEEYRQYNIGKNEIIDLSVESGIKTYTIELIIGSSNQLDDDNIRYIIKVYVTNTIQEEIGYELYLQDTNGIRSKVTPERVTSAVNTQLFEITANEWSVPEPENGSQYYLNLSSVANEHPNIRTEVYDFWDYTLNGTSANPITSKVLEQNMMQSGNGLPIGYGSENTTMLALVYFDKDNQIIGQSFVSFAAVKDITYIKANLYQKMNDEFTDIVMLDADHIGFKDIDSVFAGAGVHELCLMLKDGYSASSDIYCVLEAHGATYGDDANSYVSKAVVGHYDTLEEAAACEDIKEQLIPADKTAASRGYKSDYNYKNGGTPFTIFFEDGSVFKILVLAMEYEPEYDESYVRTFTEDPIIGEADPWFRVQGAENSNGEKYDTYVVENGKNINMDTYYGYGYQTIFINDANADLSSIKPDFWYANTDRVYAVSKDSGNRVDENHIRDFNEENQQYTGVIIDKDGKENERNYWVTFKKLNNNGPELYVYGPSEREVILDEYFEFKHDILIANIGNAPLEDISVELLDAKNVKLDSYWTVGGDGNNTLSAFTTTSTNTDYGELANMAKIRLLPDGDGQVEGTLIIRAKGQEPVMITLNGTAQNPEIITETLSDAVKYVPYQQIVATNNMHDWVETKFSIVGGTLPEGITLNSETGEIYGVPTVPDGNSETTYSFTVEAKYLVDGEEGYFDPSYKDFKLVVKPNTDENVYLASDSDEGYSIKQPIGTQTGDYSFELNEIADTVFTSNGEYGEFVGLWLNGELLEPGVDYDSESGSTKITIKSQTFENRADKDGTNTIAMEFRKDTNGDGKGDSGAEMNRTAQNFTVNEKPTQAEIDKAAANKVISLIGSIPSTVTLNDREIINEARTAYNALTSVQQELVTNYDRLTRAEAAIKQLEENAKDKAAADKVVNMINALPNPITLDSKSAVNAARNAYNMLTASQKGYVTNYTKLQEAENKIVALEKEAGETDSITFVGILVDKNGESCDDKIVEIHSTVQTGRTDENGSFQFNNVEFGQHIIYVKDVNENVLAQKEFNIKLGSPVALNGDDIIAENGSVFTVKMQLDGDELTFLNVEEGNKAPVIDIKQDGNGIDIGDDGKIPNTGTTSPQTGDHANLPVWYALLIASLSVLIMMVCVNIKKGKRLVNTGDKK